ncbi:MAG: hypothetical protein QOF82_708 [Frankiales bacterium]|nr:hypothetical protein [Frankiales bacterium]
MLTTSPAWRTRLPRRWTGRVQVADDAAMMPLRNRDGTPAVIRDQANRAWLDGERARLRAELDRTDAGHSPTGSHRPPRWKSRAVRLRAKLQALDGLHTSLDRYGDTYLIALDASRRNVKAILSHGNPETADHVVVSVPGMGAQVDFACTVDGMARETSWLREEATAQLQRVGRDDESVAAVAWIWYDTPPWQAPAALRGRAFRAAPELAKYLRAVRRTSVNPGLHLTLVGHSYGSLVAGLALHDGASTVVDDYVAYGSAGFYARDEAALGMERGHVFVMLAPDDPIRFPARLGLFGGDPAVGAFRQLSTAAATTPDGVRRVGACGHAGYPRSFSRDGRDMLFTTGFNTAVVAAGLAELAVSL